MRQSYSTILFFKLIRIALNTDCNFPDDITREQWEDIYEISKKQTLAGITFIALEKLPEAKRPPKDILIKWYLYSERLKNENKKQNKYAHKITELFLKDGFKSAILKGQGIALLYPQPLYRHPGDIDIWLDGTREKVIKYIDTISPNSEPVYHHVDFPILRDIDVEIHFTPSWMNNYFVNRKLQKFFKENAEPAFNNSVRFEDDCYINVPTLSFNRVFILLHIYRHLFAEGIGLRQILDYYMVLTAGFTPKEKEETITALKEFNLYGFARATMYVLQKVFKMPEKFLIAPPDKRQGEFLINEIMLSGNFGAFDNRISKKLYSNNPFVRFIYKTKRNIRFLKYHPLEIMYAPFFRIWHYFWRKGIKNKILNSK